jgi:hypothetical protein
MTPLPEQRGARCFVDVTPSGPDPRWHARGLRLYRLRPCRPDDPPAEPRERRAPARTPRLTRPSRDIPEHWPSRVALLSKGCDVLRAQRRILCEMERLIGVAVLLAITLLAAACNGGHRLSAPLQKRIAAMVREKAGSLGDPTVKTAQVYGPATRVALLEASLGQGVSESPHKRRAGFYLIVLHGHFVCRGCPHLRAPSPRGTIATQLWSPTVAAYGVFSLGDRLPASMSRLGKPTVISLG